MSVIAELESRRQGPRDGPKRGVFCPFGEGDVDIEAVIAALLGRDYRGWLVVEQDQALGTSDTPASVIAGQRFNLEYLRRFGG